MELAYPAAKFTTFTNDVKGINEKNNTINPLRKKVYNFEHDKRNKVIFGKAKKNQIHYTL